MASKEGIPNGDADLLRRSLDGMPAGLLTIDVEGLLVQSNIGALELAPFLALGINLREELERVTHVEKVDRLLIRGEVVSFPIQPDGPELHWLCHPSNLKGERVVSLWEVDWADDMYERKADFTMAASHELRGPLTTLRGFAEILNMDTGNLTAEQAEAAAIVERTARHLTVLVEDVFDLSRNSFGELRLNLCGTDMEEVIESVMLEARPRVALRQQVLDFDIERPLPVIEADQARAIQMISNLVNNASIHNPNGTSIRIVAAVDGDRISVSVEDDGDGLPFEDPEEAFRTFRRGDRSTAGDRTGSGMGLSITKRLVELHRGDITVDSSPGSGTRFTLWFPIDRSTALTPGKPGPA
jgi:signal transduction histidine kinase